MRNFGDAFEAPANTSTAKMNCSWNRYATPSGRSPTTWLVRLNKGDRIEGIVYFQKPKGSKVEITPNSMLDEIDIPIKDVTFRF
jgi:hypothetical protein